MSDAAEGRTRSHHLFDAWNSHEVERVVGLYTPELYFLDPTTSAPVIGHEGVRHYAEVMFRCFPDGRFEVQDVVQQGDKEVANWEFSGTQEGPFMHRPPTGKRIRFRGIDWLEWDGELVRRNITYYDTALILDQIG